MKIPQDSIDTTADRLVELYAKAFGGKDKGRYRIAAKIVRQLVGRKRLYDVDIRDLTRAMYERGYLMIDMEAFFVVISANTFANYRRANEDALT